MGITEAITVMVPRASTQWLACFLSRNFGILRINTNLTWLPIETMENSGLSLSFLCNTF